MLLFTSTAKYLLLLLKKKKLLLLLLLLKKKKKKLLLLLLLLPKKKKLLLLLLLLQLKKKQHFFQISTRNVAPETRFFCICVFFILWYSMNSLCFLCFCIVPYLDCTNVLYTNAVLHLSSRCLMKRLPFRSRSMADSGGFEGGWRWQQSPLRGRPLSNRQQKKWWNVPVSPSFLRKTRTDCVRRPAAGIYKRYSRID